MSRALTDDDLARFQAQLCDVAEVMFAERGAEQVSMRQIAAALGVSPMTPYRYFASRDDILAAVRIRGFERFADQLEAAYAATPGAAAKAAAAGRAYLDFALSNANTYRLMFEQHQQEDGSDSALGRAVARARATLSVYGDGLIGSGMAETEARALELLIWSTLHGAVTLELAGTTPPGSARQTLEWLGRLGMRA
ncbi:TetR family transcriptional regulator [Porphyrobacter sp. SLTP]|uniref:TetR/AcrR family transcriptional regulator n=1 Tax=Porphyrobacter sp. SLTP TaxID=2683266 RepID=UPI001412A54D|nr:TetR/AcrR family transcriptional regulator [Porphyrobacter sp. SLTP]NBB23649.1 TetR family transcriptional regulator [Porphyrobacter sp. SLTP]